MRRCALAVLLLSLSAVLAQAAPVTYDLPTPGVV